MDFLNSLDSELDSFNTMTLISLAPDTTVFCPEFARTGLN